uniref:Uncharacterized protein n=1 Tax=Arundo donax TaxID=35708 RepID=A0A0A8XQH0_ARUDO
MVLKTMASYYAWTSR